MNKTISSKRYSTLIEWLKVAREEQGMSMRALGDKLDQQHTFIQKVESLERKLDVYEYVQYCTALDVDPCLGIERFLKSS